MMEISTLEMQRTLRRNLVPSEEGIAAIVRQTCHLSEQDWPHDRLLAHTRRGLDRAVGWGLSTPDDVIGFLALRHQFGERFDEFPAVRKFLARTDLPPDGCIQLMMLELPMGIWDVVRRRTPAGESSSPLGGPGA